MTPEPFWELSDSIYFQFLSFSIGWNHGKTYAMMLEDFESARPARRAQLDLVLTRGERHRLLVEWGASGQDVIEAIRMIIRVKNQRRRTVNNLGIYDRIEELWEILLRNAKRVICRSSSNLAAHNFQEASERTTAVSGKKSQLVKASSSIMSEAVTIDARASERPEDSPPNSKRDSSTITSQHSHSEPPCSEANVVKNHSETCSQCAAAKRAKASVPKEAPKGKQDHRIKMEAIVKVTKEAPDGSAIVEQVKSTKVISEGKTTDYGDVLNDFLSRDDPVMAASENTDASSDISESSQSPADESNYCQLSARMEELLHDLECNTLPLEEVFSAKHSCETSLPDDDVDNMSNPQSHDHNKEEFGKKVQ